MLKWLRKLLGPPDLYPDPLNTDLKTATALLENAHVRLDVAEAKRVGRVVDAILAAIAKRDADRLAVSGICEPPEVAARRAEIARLERKYAT
jgi:hypothetical protein